MPLFKKIIFCFFIILFSFNSGFANTFEELSKIISYGKEITVIYFNGKERIYRKGEYQHRWTELPEWKPKEQNNSKRSSSSSSTTSSFMPSTQSTPSIQRNISGIVIAIRHGEKYHYADCPTLNNTPDDFLRSVTVAQAKTEGYNACKVCNPPDF